MRVCPGHAGGRDPARDPAGRRAAVFRRAAARGYEVEPLELGEPLMCVQ